MRLSRIASTALGGLMVLAVNAPLASAMDHGPAKHREVARRAEFTVINCAEDGGAPVRWTRGRERTQDRRERRDCRTFIINVNIFKAANRHEGRWPAKPRRDNGRDDRQDNGRDSRQDNARDFRQGNGRDFRQGNARDSRQGNGRDDRQGNARDSRQGNGRDDRQGNARDSRQDRDDY